MQNRSFFFRFLLPLFFLALIISLSTIQAGAEVPYRNYTYNFWGEPVRGPQAYLPNRVLTGEDLDVGDFDSPEEIFVHRDQIYVVDTGNSRIVVFDDNFNLEYIIDSFANQAGEEDGFDNPHGLFVNDDYLLLADTDNSRLVLLDETEAGDFRGRAIEEPESDVDETFGENYNFVPTGVLMDEARRIYVIARGEYQGLMQFNWAGEFTGFMGAPEVTPDPVDYLWAQLATREQRERMEIFLPIEYNQFTLDERGFILAVSSSDDVEQRVRRLNPAGLETLRSDGFHPVAGDIDYPGDAVDHLYTYTGPSQLVDVVSRQGGRYSILDSNRNRIFTYDELGNLLYVFGGPGNQKGNFYDPVSMEIVGSEERFLILDQDREEITEFVPTGYTGLIHSALDHYNRGQYGEATGLWQRVLQHNLNFEPAYIGIGRAHIRREEWEEALDYLRLGNDRATYSQAFTEYRRRLIEDNFSALLLSLALVILALFLISRYKDKIGAGRQPDGSRMQSLFLDSEDSLLIRVKKVLFSLKYALKVMAHPFGTFWELKHEKKGNLPASIILVVGLCAVFIFWRFNLGFVFNEENLAQLNIWNQILGILIPFFLWCVVNWALTTLMEGKGTFREIVVATSFAFSPLIVMLFPLTIISNYLTLQEAALYNFFLVLGTAWSLLLVFLGTLSIHDYTLTKAILTTIGIILGMGLVFFLILLFVDQIEMLVGFITSIYRELFLRV